jgi:hypothetical protein
MANQAYGKGRENILDGSVDLLTDNLKCVLVDTAAYTISVDVDEFLSDIPAGARIATSGNLANKTVTLGVFDADDIAVLTVAGASVEAIVIYRDTGVAATSQLLIYLDTGVGLPFTPNGGNVVLQWDSGANKIFNWAN